MYGRWESFWALRAGHNTPDTLDKSESAGLFLDKFLRGGFGACLGGPDNANWTCIGPFRNSFGQASESCQKNGRINALWIDPDNPDYILAGAAAGGIWKTADGGQNWSNITDQSQDVVTGTMGITDIAVSPLNKQVIYAATGTIENFIYHWEGQYGLGLIRSSNGGQSWTADNNFRSLTGTMGVTGCCGEGALKKLAYRPGTDVLYAVMGKRVFRKPTAYLPWQEITPTMISALSPDYFISDFEFTSNPAGRVVFSTNCQGNEQYLFIYDEVNNNWQPRTIIIPGYAHGGQGFNGWGIQEIALTAADVVFMRLQLYNPLSTKSHLLYKVGLGTGSIPVLVNNNLHDWPARLIISPANANIVYLTNTWGHPDFIYRSTDGGASFPDKIGETHADGRCLVLYRATNSPGGINDILYCGTDGGVAKKAAGNTMLHSITGNGLCITQFYGLSSNPANDGMLTAGAQDNGAQSYHRANTAVPWSETTDHGLAWGDGLRPAFARNGLTQSYTQTNGATEVFSFGTTVNNTTINSPDVDASPGPSFLRPIKFDAGNTARLGYHYIWKQQIGATAWTQAFSSEIKAYQFGSPEMVDKTSLDFIISETDNNKAYLAYLLPSWRPGYHATERYGRLFYTSNTNFVPIPWQNITPPVVEYCTITDVETDPRKPERVWVSFGNVDWSQLNITAANRQNRVYYSADAGRNNSWTDVSKGLPPLPILKLLYVEGSDDVLFAATDVGVYRWSKARQQWECFTNGMPKAIVTDMEMNYCSGKLRVSTFGRGIWETPIEDNPSSLAPVGETNVITSNTTWSSSKTINGSIRVKAGATLTISGTGTTIYMPSRGKIAVERGARLIIDAARITNECDGALWLGIQVAGDINRPSDPAYQGYLELKNNALLEHARLAILNFELGENTGGGIIKASNSRINNCKMAVCLNNYPNYTYFTPGTITSNCKFDNVQFIKDDPRYEIDGSGYFASWLIRGGVDIRNCTFRYSVPWQQLPYLNRSSAINVSTTGMRVESCVFDGYRRGVYISGYDNSITAPIIYNNTFDHNSESITVAASLFADIRGNVIRNMYPYKTSSGNTITYRYPVGIYLDMGAGSYVGCSNTVSGTIDGGPNDMFLKRLGLLANNNGFHNIIVTDNNFNDLSIGTQTQGSHFYLNIFCNNYNRNQLAWAVNPHALGQVEFLNDQGTSCDPVDGIRAGNRFMSNQRDINSYSAVPWRYYAGNGAYESPVWAGLMTINNCGTNSNSQCNLPQSCPQRFMTRQAHNILLNVYNLMVKSGGQYSLAGRIMQTQLIWGYKDLEDEAGLMTFLEKEKDVSSRKLLIPMYINAAMYSQALSTIQSLDLPLAESEAYTDYYGIMIGLKQQGRRIDALNPEELDLIMDLAETNLEVSRLAKGLLEYAYGQDWLHPIEELPADPMSKKIQIPETPGRQPSMLADAVPNPAGQSTMIFAMVSADDMALQPRLVIRSSQGHELWKTPLSAGENRVTVPVNSWPAGVYFYTLELGNKVIASKKLSVVYQ